MERYKILLVDDERTEREGISFLIQRYGYPLEIQQAVNGRKALELMEQEKFDILFTDVRMPIMDGLDLSKEASQLYPDTIIIIFSAYSEFDYAKKAMEAGVVNYLLKPIELDEFQRCMVCIYQYFTDSARMDLDDCHNNFYAGIHGANMAGTWQTLANGFGGMRMHHGKLSFKPNLPKNWDRLTFRVKYLDSVGEVRMEKTGTYFTVVEGNPVIIYLREKAGEKSLAVSKGETVYEEV